MGTVSKPLIIYDDFTLVHVLHRPGRCRDAETCSPSDVRAADLLPAAAIAGVTVAVDALNGVLNEKHTGKIRIKMEELEFAANKWLKPYPHAAWRENVEVLLVALAVAMAIRTFFIQPFKIPTGSMQPTLFGVTADNLADNPGFKIPTGWNRVKEWFAGVSYVHVVAKADGEIEKN